MSQGIIDPPYYFWGMENEDEGLFYFCSKRSVLKELAEKSTAGIAGWTFSESDYYYGMSRELYQPLTNYLSKVVSVGIEMFKSHSQSPLPYFLEHLLEPTNRSIVSPPEIFAINTGIKNKDNKWIYALCIHRDHICDEKYLTYLRINREDKARIVQEMENRNACYYMYALRDEKLPENLQAARGEAPPSFYGKIYEMAININNLTINKQNSILGDPNHYYEHMDRIPGGLRPDCIDNDCINRVKNNSDIINNDNRIDNRHKKKRIKEQRIKDFKDVCPQKSQELFELRMEKVIHQAIERVKRNPRLAIPYGLNDTNKETPENENDTLSLGQFVIPLYYEGKVVLGLTLRCKVNKKNVEEMLKIIANSLEKGKESRTRVMDEYYEILKFRYCTYSVDTILPLPIVRMNVLPYVDCDVSNLWCFNNH